jgi:hypothetical protein
MKSKIPYLSCLLAYSSLISASPPQPRSILPTTTAPPTSPPLSTFPSLTIPNALPLPPGSNSYQLPNTTTSLLSHSTIHSYTTLHPSRTQTNSTAFPFPTSSSNQTASAQSRITTTSTQSGFHSPANSTLTLGGGGGGGTRNTPTPTSTPTLTPGSLASGAGVRRGAGIEGVLCVVGALVLGAVWV